MKTITLASLDEYLQDRLKNSVGSPLSQIERVRIINQTIQLLQSLANWHPTKRVVTFDYLKDESDYSIVNDLGISDFKDVKAIRDPNEAYERFEPDDEGLIDELIAEGRLVNTYAVEERDNADILRLIYSNGNTRTQLAALDSLTEDGTWASDTTNSDATTLAADTNRYKEGGGSLAFNIDVSQSANNKAAIRNTTLTAVDLSDYENIAHFRAWLDLHQLTTAQLGYISSAEIRFGDDTSNYWAISVTTAINGGAFKAGWNRIGWDWKNATQTGSPTASSINYIELIINYSASMTDASNVRWDDLVAILPRELEMVYFSEYMVKDGATWQAEFSTDEVDTTEILLLPTRHRDGFVHLASVYGFHQMKEEGNADEIRAQMRADKAFKAMFDDIGEKILREVYKVTPRGLSSGRTEGYRLQW